MASKSPRPKFSTAKSGALAALLFLIPGASAAIDIVAVETDGKVTAVGRSASGPYARTTRGAFAIKPCGETICLVPAKVRVLSPRAPNAGLPDGGLATGRADIRRAWYSEPTTRYGHAVLGDGIEAGALHAVDGAGQNHTLRLGKEHVFEDITPRIADLDGDGKSEIVTIRSSLTRGAQIAVYGVRNGELALLAITKPIGKSRRWLNIAGIGAYLKRSERLIAWVETPHIGGTLKFARFNGRSLRTYRRSVSGLSNHFIGSRVLDMAASVDMDRDGVTDLVMPSARRDGLVVVSRGKTRTLPLPGGGRVGHGVLKAGPGAVTATEDGRLLFVRP